MTGPCSGRCMQPYSPPLKPKSTHGSLTLTGSKQSCTTEHGGKASHTVTPDCKTENRQAGRGSAGTIINQMDAQRVAPTQHGLGPGPHQSKGRSITTVPHASSGTSSQGNTWRVTLTVPTRLDQNRKPPEVTQSNSQGLRPQSSGPQHTSCHVIMQGMVKVNTWVFILRRYKWHLHAGSWSLVNCWREGSKLPYKGCS